MGTDADVAVTAAARKLYRTILAATFPSRNERDEDAIVGVDLEVTRVQSASVRLTVTTTPNLRTVARSSTSAWHLVRRVEDNFWPRIDAHQRKRIVTV